MQRGPARGLIAVAAFSVALCGAAPTPAHAAHEERAGRAHGNIRALPPAPSFSSDRPTPVPAPGAVVLGSLAAGLLILSRKRR
jgi:hypothetical protein